MLITFVVFQNFLQLCKKVQEIITIKYEYNYYNIMEYLYIGQLIFSIAINLLLTDQFQGRPSELCQAVCSISSIFPNMHHPPFYYVRHIIQKVLNVHVAVILDEVSRQRL